MSTENTELLEKSVIDLTLKNQKLKKELIEIQDSKDMWFKWYQEKSKILEKKENEIPELNKKISDLEYFKTTTLGLWAFDRAPSEVDAEWIKENAFQIEEPKNGKVVLESVNVDEETE